MSRLSVAPWRAARPRCLSSTRIAELVPDFGKRQMTWADFLVACARGRITLETRPLSFVDGKTFGRVPSARILIDSRLPDPYRVFVAFHELGHAVSDPVPEHVLRLDSHADYLECRRLEAAADAIGLRALIPSARRLWSCDRSIVGTGDRGPSTVAYHYSALRGRAWRRGVLTMQRYREVAA